MISVQIDDHGTIERLQELTRQVDRPRAVMAAVGREAGNRLKAHFREKDKTPNKLGGQRQHFWLEVSRTVQVPVVDADGRAVTITVSHPAIAQKVFGGTIEAKRARALTIPVDPEAYGRRASVFEQETGLTLFLVKSDSKAFLATRAEGGGIKVRYLLTPSVEQAPDPTALPDMSDGSVFARGLIERAESVVKRVNS